jgi:hypothetical protein
MSGINEALLTSALGDPDISRSISNFSVTLKSMADLRFVPGYSDVWELKQPVGKTKPIQPHEYDFAQKICSEEKDSIVLYGKTQVTTHPLFVAVGQGGIRMGFPARALLTAWSAVRPCSRPVAMTEAAAA